MKGLGITILAHISGFIISSILIVGFRTLVADLNCDPKFHCLCSFTCMLPHIAICAFVLFISTLIAYVILGREKLKALNKLQLKILFVTGSILGAIVFSHPLLTILFVYTGYLMVWLPFCLVTSLIIIKIIRKYNKSINADTKPHV